MAIASSSVILIQQSGMESMCLLCLRQARTVQEVKCLLDNHTKNVSNNLFCQNKISVLFYMANNPAYSLYIINTVS